MAMRLLVDAAHPEETRVVVLNGNRLEDFDYASSTKTQLRGNIYLAKVTRVEPSLQAAFVDYGGNRHGFLAFSEIHPDYYQIPVADREALLAAEAAQQQADAESENLIVEVDDPTTDEPETIMADGDQTPPAEDDETSTATEHGDDNEVAVAGEDEDTAAESEIDESEPPEAEVLSSEDEAETARRRRARLVRSYKIQEVIKRRQVLLVQVVKEERGNKGAALTSYLSLAGRYGVLMPNTARGGGISRKIADSKDRKRLRKIVDDLEVPQGMGLIIRTAGANRSKAEIKRDYEFLLRSWDSVRDLTLKSTAPMMVYEEANLIKRAIRDLYSKDVEEVLVEGEDAYKAAKRFMRMLMPSHAKRVQPYQEKIPLFHRYQVEELFDAMHATEVRLKGGGYIVISPTEALVAIDVNSGKATKERNIEETALRTNLEAAEELARHLRLRDLGGLIVVDFIDMNENRHNRAVERRLKDSLKDDRARIQIGRISSFGLLEMSRQRMRPSLFEASSEPCSRCRGTGSVRSRESTALHVLRAIETEGIRKSGGELTISVATPVAIYLLNQKRPAISEIENRYGLSISVIGDDTLVPPEIRIERSASTTVEEVTVEVEERVADAVSEEETAAPESDEDGQRGKRRRRGRRGGRRRKRASGENQDDASQENVETQEAASGAGDRDQAATPAPDTAGEGADEKEITVPAANEPIEVRIVEVASETASPAVASHDDPDDATDSGGDGISQSDPTESEDEPERNEDEPERNNVTHIGESETNPSLAADSTGTDDSPRKARRGWWRRVTE